MAKPLKFLRGPMLTSLHEIVCEIEAGRVIIFAAGHCEKRLSRAFYQNWTLAQFKDRLNRQQLFRSLENKEWWERECRRIAGDQ